MTTSHSDIEPILHPIRIMAVIVALIAFFAGISQSRASESVSFGQIFKPLEDTFHPKTARRHHRTTVRFHGVAMTEASINQTFKTAGILASQRIAAICKDASAKALCHSERRTASLTPGPVAKTWFRDMDRSLKAVFSGQRLKWSAVVR